MEDMKHKDLTPKVTQPIVELQPLFQITPHSTDLSSSHLKQQMGEDQVIIDIKSMIEKIKDDHMLPTCCIHRVPPAIRQQNKVVYTPKVVTIGPLHHGNEMPQDMERYKQRFFKIFTQNTKTSLNDLVSFVKDSEPKVRDSYSRNIKLNKEEFVKLILVDAGFIIELFRSYHHRDEMVNNANESQLWLLDTIRRDLLLLENQLPFFVIEGLFNKAFPLEQRGDDHLPSFRQLTYEYFDCFNMQKLEPDPEVKIYHFTDLLRLFYLPRTKPKRSSLKKGGHDLLLYTAYELKEVGVKLKVSRSKCLLDLKFSGRDLEVPRIFVEDETELLFRNVIALEQFRYSCESYFTDFVMVLDCLINTEKDVDVLIHKKIIHNLLGDTKEVAKLFNGLSKSIGKENFNVEYRRICEGLNGFKQNRWRKMKATLRRDYCRTPWQTVASIAGIVLLILTLIQTIFTVHPG